MRTGTGVAIQLLIGPWVHDQHLRHPDHRLSTSSAVLTNTAPTGAYRGAGRPEAIYIIERLMDEAARQTGIDPAELRRRNFIRPEQMPYTNPMGQVYDSGALREDHGPGRWRWPTGTASTRARAESKRRGKLRGRGIATFLEWTGGNVFEERVTVDGARPTA